MRNFLKSNQGHEKKNEKGGCDCMETFYLNQEDLVLWQKKARPSVMALGFFDGIHIGHLKVIRRPYKSPEKKTRCYR